MTRWMLVLVLLLSASGCADNADSGEDTVLGADTRRAGDTVPVPGADVVGEADQRRTDDMAAETSGDTAFADLVEALPDPGVTLREQGWLRGDLHMHTTHSDGEDALRIVIELAEYLESPEFLAAHPEFEGNGLDFIAITDHRTDASFLDPDWHSDRLVLIPGEEFGGPGHANLFGIDQHYAHDPDGDGVTVEDLNGALDAVHAAGAIMSVNHPTSAGIPWPWDVSGHDAVEIWNTQWSLMSADYLPEGLDSWEASHGEASVFFRRAVQEQGSGGSGQALKLYEAWLSRGHHMAVLGGSDRHALFTVGFPTTWILAPGGDLDGVMEGLAARHTFVSRRPTAATVQMTVETAAGTGILGDALGVAAQGEDVTITLHAGRATGGLLRLVHGAGEATDEGVLDAPLGQVVFETEIPSSHFETTVTLPVMPGDFVYPVVLEPLVAPDLAPGLADLVPSMAQAALEAGEEDYQGLLETFWDVVDFTVVLSPQDCDPANWVPEKMQCLPPDDNGVATFFVPDWVDRALNAYREAGTLTDYCVGAVGSAVLF